MLAGKVALTTPGFLDGQFSGAASESILFNIKKKAQIVKAFFIKAANGHNFLFYSLSPIKLDQGFPILEAASVDDPFNDKPAVLFWIHVIRRYIPKKIRAQERYWLRIPHIEYLVLFMDPGFFESPQYYQSTEDGSMKYLIY
jgi:hypothetical protein